MLGAFTGGWREKRCLSSRQCHQEFPWLKAAQWLEVEERRSDDLDGILALYVAAVAKMDVCPQPQFCRERLRKKSSWKFLFYIETLGFLLVTGPNANVFPLLDQNAFKFWLLINKWENLGLATINQHPIQLFTVLTISFCYFWSNKTPGFANA